MIIIQVLKVGIGNQLFEYAYGRYLAKKYNQKLYMYFPAKMDHGYIYENGLGALNIRIDKKVNWLQMIFLSKGKNILHLMYMFIRKFFYNAENINLEIEKTMGEKLARKGILINYDSMNIKSYFDQNRKDTFVRGYFQFPQYVYANKAELVSLLKFREKKYERYMNVINAMQNCESVAIHIRRGDYLCNKTLTICADSYYISAIKKMNYFLTNPTFYIFSDDCDYIRSKMFWFENRETYFIQDMFNNIEDVDELRLMGYCKHFIISNSTFSWWGQFAGTDVDKIVIAPNKWYASGDNGFLYEKKWCLLDC